MLLVSDLAPGTGRGALFLVGRETGERRLLTMPPEGSVDGQGVFSPDGRHIAFVRAKGGVPATGDIWVLSVDGAFRPIGEARQLTSDGLQNLEPAWTADGKEVVYASERRGRPGLWKVAAAGGQPARLQLAGNEPHWPAIRGARLAYVHHVIDTNMWHIPTSGGGPAVRLPGSTLRDEGAEYSPDGRKIAYSSNQTGSFEVWVAQNDGSQPTQLTSFGEGETGSPRWSPDGRQIAFDSNSEAGQFEIYIVAADGGKPQRLTDSPAEDAVPNFSRDGKSIYFESDRTGRREIWNIPSIGGLAVQVTKNGGYAVAESADGARLYYTKQNEGALWQMPTTGGPESQVLDGVALRNFAVVKAGIYFMRRERDAIIIPTPEV